MKKKNNYASSMRELEDMFYKNDVENFEKRKRYLDTLTTDINSPEREKLAKKLMNFSLNIKKIPEQKGVKTPDYVIISEKIYIEVKGFDLPTQRSPRYDLKASGLIQKIDNKIDEISEKDKLGHPEYNMGGIIFFCVILSAFIEMQEDIIKELVIKSKFKESDIDFLLTTHDPYSDSSGTILGPPLLFVKGNKYILKLQKVFPNVKIIQL